MRIKLLSGLVVGLVAAAPASAELLYATNGTNLARFDSTSLGAVTTVPITGLQGGDTIVGIDVRPADQLVYAVGSSSRVYRIAPLTGIATLVGGPAATLSGTKFGVDFNPVPDRIRLTSNTQQSLRLNPNDGTLSGTDTNLSAANIAEVAYTNNFAGTATTTLYGINPTNDTLNMIGGLNGSPSPNLGAVTQVGAGLGVDAATNVGFDISGFNGAAFAALNVGGVERLYTIDLTSGSATLVGTIGDGSASYVGLAAATAPEPGTIGLLGVAVGAAVMRRTRRAAA